MLKRRLRSCMLVGAPRLVAACASGAGTPGADPARGSEPTSDRCCASWTLRVTWNAGGGEVAESRGTAAAPRVFR